MLGGLGFLLDGRLTRTRCRKHWAALGDMDTHTAMATFCNVLQSNDSNWTEYLLEEKRKIDEGLRQEWEEIEVCAGLGVSFRSPKGGSCERMHIGPLAFAAACVNGIQLVAVGQRSRYLPDMHLLMKIIPLLLA